MSSSMTLSREWGLQNPFSSKNEPLIGFAVETTYSLGSIGLTLTARDISKIVEFIMKAT